MNWKHHRHAPGSGSHLCSLDAVPDGSFTERRYGEGDDALGILVFRQGAAAWAFANVCPHFSLPLNARPGEFLVVGPRRLMCAYHCAVFRFEDGLCIEGPAEGLRLDEVPLELCGGQIYVGPY